MIRVALALVTSVVLVGTAGSAVAAPSAPARAPAAVGSQAVTDAGSSAPDMDGGSSHSVVIGAGGIAYATGENDYGQLGDGTTVGRDSLVPMTGLPDGVTATAVAAGDVHSVVLGSDGIPYATGINGSGQLGDGTTDENTSLTPMTGLPAGVSATAAGAGSFHTIVLGSDGIPYATGWNGSGQLGDGTWDGHHSLIPMAGLPAGVTATAVAAGDTHSLVLGSDGIAYATGNNDFGQLGDGTTDDHNSLTPMAGLPAGITATAIAAGGSHSVTIGSDGIPYATGRNNHGQLGEYASLPSRSHLGPMLGLPEGVSATSIAAGYLHTLVVGDDGTTYGAGTNAEGELADGTSIDQGRLTAMIGLPTGVTAHAVAAGDRHTLVRGSDGLVYGGGGNSSGQLTTSADVEQRTLVLLAGQSWSNQVRPSIRRKARVGSTARINLGKWSTPPATLRYKWIRDGSKIKGATASTYVPRPRDLGDRLKVRITAKHVGLHTIRVTTKTVKVARGVAPKYTAKRPRLKGRHHVGKVLRLKGFHARAFTPEPSHIRIHWLRNGHAIKGAHNKTYRIHRADRGKKLQVKITAKLRGHKPGTVKTKRVRIRR